MNANRLIQNVIELENVAQYNKLRKHGVKLDFVPTGDTLKIAHQLYEPLQFIPGVFPGTAHQLAAIHNRFAENQLYHYARNHKPCIEIGPNIISFMKIGQSQPKVHGCCLMSGRDQIRFVNAAASTKVRGSSDPTFTAAVNGLASGLESDKFCNRGWENCTFQASTAIANHSLYDITLENLAVGMAHHNTLTVHAYMHLYPAALKTDQYIDHKMQSTFRVMRNKEGKPTKLLAGFPDDPAWMYEHDYDTIMSYLVRSGCETPFGFNLVIERVRNYGSHFFLKISRTNLPIRIHCMIPSSWINVVGVPNVVEAARNGFRGKTTYLYASKDKVQRLFCYLMARDKKDDNLSVAFAYARSQLRSVRIGETIVDTSWDVETKEFLQIVVSVYLLVRLHALRVDYTIDLAIRKIGELKGGRGWLARHFPTLATIFENIVHNCMQFFEGEPNLPSILSGKSPLNYFNDLDFLYFHDELIMNEFNAQSAIPEVCFEKFKHYYEDEGSNEPMIEDRFENGVETIIRDEGEQTIEPFPFKLYEEQDQWARLIAEMEETVGTMTLENKPEKVPLLTVLKGAFDALSKFEKENGVPMINPEKFQGSFGCAGSGKTTNAFNKHVPEMCGKPGDKFLYVSPSRTLLKAMGAHVPIPNRGLTMHTAITILQAGTFKPNLIVVDEAFRIPLPILAFYSHFAPVLLIGDPMQITHIDYSTHDLWRGCFTLVHVYKCFKRELLVKTRRIPLDICKLPFIARTYPGITTTSRRGTSDDRTTACGPSFHLMGPKFKKENAVVLTLTQATKALYANEGARTVDEAQGSTFDSVILHLGESDAEKWLLENSPQHLVVGLTRHLVNLYVRETRPGIFHEACERHATVGLDIIMDATNVVEPIQNTIKAKSYATTALIYAPVAFQPASVSVQVVSDYVADIFPGVGEVHEYQDVEAALYPNHGGLKGGVRIDDIHVDAIQETKEHSIYRFPVAQRVQIKNSRKVSQSLHTMMSRYSKQTKNMHSDKVREEALKLHAILEHFIDFDYDVDEKDEAFGDACVKFMQRGNNIEDLMELDCWTDNAANMVKFNMKTQQKLTKGDPLTSDKAGQGIAAWSKELNFAMCVWMRLLERCFMRSTKGFIFASNRTDAEVLQLLDRISAECPNAEYLEGDWKEFDSSQNNVEHELMMISLEKLGCPYLLRANFLSMMQQRYVQARFGGFEVYNKKDSGRVDTLIGNTQFNAAVLLSCLNYQQIDFCLFKGDDSLIVGDNIRVNNARLKEIDAEQSFQIEIRKSRTAEFTNFIITPAGAALNIPKLTAKVLTRVYTEAKYDEYTIAIKDLIKSTNDVETAANMCRNVGLHYGINEAASDNMLSFLYRFSRKEIGIKSMVKFERMTKVMEN